MKPKNKKYKLVKVFNDQGFCGFLERDMGSWLVCYNPWNMPGDKYDTFPADECRIEKEFIELKPKTDREPEPNNNSI